MLEIKQEISNYYELKDQLWGDNVEYELKQVEEYGMEEEFFSHLEGLFWEAATDITTINDYIAYEFSFMDWIKEHKTLDDIDSLEELQKYTEGDAYNVIENAINSNYADELWNYISDEYIGDYLATIIEEISSLEPNDYIGFDCILSLNEFISLVKDNKEVMETIEAAKNLDEYWDRLEKEYKGINYTISNVVDDIESELDVEEE